MAIIGGGIGGLALAQGLVGAGFTVSVFERDSRPEDTGGYRLHLTAQSRRALRYLLPAELAEAIDATAAPEGSFDQIAVFDHRGRTRARFRMADEDRLLIGRRPLRRLLANGLEDVIKWDTRVAAVAEHPDGAVITDTTGGEMKVDVVVGADGPGSIVTQQVTGRPASRPSGLGAISGIVDLTDHPEISRPEDLRRGLGLAIGPAGIGMFLALHHPRRGQLATGAIPEKPYLVWSVIAEELRYSADITRMSQNTLIDECHLSLRPWAQSYHDLVRATRPSTLAAFRFQFPGALGPWESDRITMLGDAIHTMPPTAGAGASTAVIDAANITDALRSAPVPEALRAYQRQMLGYAADAVAKAEPALLWQRRLSNPLLRTIAVEIGLPTASGLARILGMRWR